MTSPPSFSAAWNSFAQTRGTAQASIKAEPEQPRLAEQIPPAEVQDRAIPGANAVEKTPDAGTRLSATTAASASISALEKPSFAERCFNGLSYAAFLALPLLLLVQFTGGLHTITPWLFPQEAHFAQSYEFMVASGRWLAPPVALPPVWFWVLRMLDALPYVDGPVIYAAGAALSGILTLLATWFLALGAGNDRRTAFASGLTLLSCLAFPALAHRVGPELLFTGLLTMGLACLIRGWNKDVSFLWLPLGCAFIALAGLAHGAFGIILPVLGSMVFLAWKGAFARFNRMDGAIGFAVLLALPLAWLGAVMLFGPDDAQLKALCLHLVAPFLPPYWPPSDPAWLYVAVLSSALAPWILVFLFVPWGGAPARPLVRLASTRKENSGSAWIWIHLVLGLLLLSASSAKFCLDATPLMPLLAIVLGKAVVSLPQKNSRAFFLMQAGLFGLAALALGLACLAQIWQPLQRFVPLPYPQGFEAIKGLPILAGICLLTALSLWKLVDRRFPGACLLACAIAITALCLPALKLTTPSMQDIFLGKPSIPASVPEPYTPLPPAVRTPASEPESSAPPAPQAEEKPAPPTEEKPVAQPEEKPATQLEEKPATPAEDIPATQAEEKPAQAP